MPSSPLTLELSLKAIEDVHQERERLHRHWKQRLERATYEAERAERQYQAVEPENRLVARSLERQWEEALRKRRDLQEEYDRFLKEQPPHLSEDQRARILALSSDLPALWNAPETTAADRKEIIRLVVERVVVHVRADDECGEVVISWRGGVTTRHEIVRPVSRYESLGRLRSVDKSNHRDASGGSDDQADRSAAQCGGVSHAKIPEGLHEHVGAEAVVPRRTDPGEDRDKAARSPRVVAAGPGPRASDVTEQATRLGAARLGSLAAGSASRSVGRLGRWTGTTAVAEAPGRLRNRARSWKQHRVASRLSVDDSRSHRSTRRGSMGSRLCDKGGVMSRRSGRTELPYPAPHLMTSLRRSAHCGPPVHAEDCTASPGVRNPSTTKAPHGYAARASASRFFAPPPGIPGDWGSFQ